MILDYTRAYGSIARGQAAELCQISPVQARYLLKNLVHQGRLRLVGERRAARYELVTRAMNSEPLGRSGA
jgi:ATP-dependent DNA helicase RecG